MPHSFAFFANEWVHCHNLTVCGVTVKFKLLCLFLGMTKGLHRYYGAQHLHFITCSCYRRQAYLNTGKRRDLFLKILKKRAANIVS